MHHKSLFLFIMTVNLSSITIFGSPQSKLPELRQKLGTLKQFKLNLTQRTFQQKELILESKGSLTLSKPDRLRLQIDIPEDEKSVLVANRTEIQAYHPGLSEELPGTLTIYETQNNPAKIWFKLFDGDLSEFSVKQSGNNLVLIPHDASGEVAQVEATIDQNYIFSRVIISYKSGTKAEFLFEGLNSSGSFENEFKISYPKNTKIDRIKTTTKNQKGKP